MAYWLYKSLKGEFSIMERSSEGVDVYFCAYNIGHFANPAEAARAIAAGSYSMPEIFADTEPAKDVPPAISNWLFVAWIRHKER